MAVSDRPSLANRDGAYEGIGEVPGAEAVHPKQRYVIRLDVDSPGALGIISGDIYVGQTFRTFEASFITRQLWSIPPESGQGDHGIAVGAGRLLEGIAELHGWSSKSKIGLRLFLPDDSRALPRLELRRRFLLSQFPRVYPTYRLELRPVKEAYPQFRRIDLEVAYQAGLPPLGVFDREVYDAKSQPSEDALGSPRPPTVEKAFADAGIRIASSVTHRTLDEGISLAAGDASGPDGLWNDEELHAAIEELGNGGEAPGWRVSLLVVSRHVNRNLAGVMFDSNLGLPRQGAAVFLDRLNEVEDSGAGARRQRLHTVIHEIGHTLNLLHSFQADRSELYRGRARPEALSWMNYPHLYPNGEAQPSLSEWYDEARANYWSRFGYTFDQDELTHLRHGALQTVMIGGSIESLMKRPARETVLLTPKVSSGLDLDLVLPSSIEFLQQLEGYVRLYNRAAKPRQIHDDLGPSAGNLAISVRRGRTTRTFQHWRTACVPPISVQSLEPGGKVYESLALSFGDRWYVDQPGAYEFQAVYQPPDGRPAVSQVRQVTVRRPWSRDAERSAADFFCNEVGLYLGLNGSRSNKLKGKADWLNGLSTRFPDRLVSANIDLAKDVMATRPLKRTNGRMQFEESMAESAADALIERCRRIYVGEPANKPRNPHISSMLIAAFKGYARIGAHEKALLALRILAGFLKSVGAPANVLRIPGELARDWRVERTG